MVANSASLPFEPEMASSASAIPQGFVRLDQRLHGWIDRKLGYFGNERFVLFYYEPRGEEVIWKDRFSYGFGAGAWCTFLDMVTPLAEQYAVDLGNDRAAGEHVLVIDRVRREAYFAERQEAERFLLGTQPPMRYRQ